MANLDFSKATTYVDMNDESLVGFDAIEEATPTLWSFHTATGNDLDLQGQGLTYDAQWHALTGIVTTIAIDVGNNDVLNPDVLITGINVGAPTLDDGADSFWRFLEGNDTFILPTAPSAGTGFSIFGDVSTARPGAASGGNDVIHAKGATAYIAGDAFHVGTEEADAPTARYQGGANQIHGRATNAQQFLVGDAAQVVASGTLTGGNDNIFIQTTYGGSFAIGDADVVYGGNGDRTEVVGGNDYIAAGTGSRATLIGDVTIQSGYSLVRGGIDEIVGAEQGEIIVGDVMFVGGSDRLVGGDDTIWGNDGDDLLVGDAHQVIAGGKVVAGNDVIFGGEGVDFIYGDTADGSSASVSGGNDELHGEGGDDLLFGRSGDDVLLGGTGKDYMAGGVGNDDYVVDNVLDTVDELAGQGVDIVKALLEEVFLAANVENLSSVWIGNFTGIGNALNNTMSAGGSDDVLSGREGNDTLMGRSGKDALYGNEGSDTLIGGAGADVLDGGGAADTASYAGATEGVKVALDGSLAGEGDALGDTFTSVERLIGSDVRDVMRGDANANVLTGAGGNDNLQAGGGSDVLVGGAGKDSLGGGAGDDRFDFLALADGGDTVADFGNTAGNNDTLRFEGNVFGGLANGALAANRFVANTAGVATTLDQRFVYETDTGILRYDANGSAAGGVTVIATLTDAPTLAAGDVSII